MNAKELRIGNYIDTNGAILRLPTALFNNRQWQPMISDWFSEVKYFQPILITTECLERLGFHCPDDSWYCYLDFDPKRETFKIAYNPEAKMWFIVGVPNSNSISYIHQLQNLYFALTGTELTIKE